MGYSHYILEQQLTIFLNAPSIILLDDHRTSGIEMRGEESQEPHSTWRKRGTNRYMGEPGWQFNKYTLCEQRIGFGRLVQSIAYVYIGPQQRRHDLGKKKRPISLIETLNKLLASMIAMRLDEHH